LNKLIVVDEAKCTGCGICVRNCPKEAIGLEDGKARIGKACVACTLCARICPVEAVAVQEGVKPSIAKCFSCPVECEIPEGYTGACKRYMNVKGEIELAAPLVVPRRKPVRMGEVVKKQVLSRPLSTGIGAGTTYPDLKPAPYILEDQIEGVDVVTVVSETPLSYCGMLVKVDTDRHIGGEGEPVKREGVKVGSIIMEQYGSKLLQIGGVNTLIQKLGAVAARTIVDLANGKKIELEAGGHKLEFRVGEPPVVDGEVEERMRVGCGSATVGMFGDTLKEVADEVVVVDHHITAVLGEHPAGRFLGLTPKGIVPRGRKSTPGRYFGFPGEGWGGTDILEPEQAIAHIDRHLAKPGMTIFIVETTGSRGALLQIQPDWSLKRLKLTDKAKEAMRLIAESCEKARVSAMLIVGVGGSARRGVTRYPLKLNEAVHRGLVKVSVGGAPTCLLPGGGITFLADVERMLKRSLHWTPTPAIIAPIEYTMEKSLYEAIGGHVHALKGLKEALKGRKIEQVD
jgi:NAD-dependent dihydropyrimidine dehydrogenase PreA subunit